MIGIPVYSLSKSISAEPLTRPVEISDVVFNASQRSISKAAFWPTGRFPLEMRAAAFARKRRAQRATHAHMDVSAAGPW